MPRMSKKKRHEMSFYISEKGRIEFNKLCKACVNTCKQSFRSIILSCLNYKSKRR